MRLTLTIFGYSLAQSFLSPNLALSPAALALKMSDPATEDDVRQRSFGKGGAGTVQMETAYLIISTDAVQAIYERPLILLLR